MIRGVGSLFVGLTMLAVGLVVLFVLTFFA
jgi:hypothetical protein